jgi:hypothetical protein
MSSEKKTKQFKLTQVNTLPNLYKEMYYHNKLILSTNIKFTNMGASWDIVQFLCSWQREKEKISIILYDALNIEKLNFNDEGLLVACYLADSVIYKEQDIKYDLLKKFVPFVENMNNNSLENYLKEKRAKEIKFICLGGVKNEFLKFFYYYDKNKNKYIFKPKGEIQKFIGNIFETPNLPIVYKKYNQNLSNIKEIIYELFSNTDKHGGRDIEDKKIDKSVRSLSLDFISFSDENRKSFLENQEEYKPFLKNVTEVLAISIFDNGEGMVKKYVETTSDKKEHELSFKDKKEILEKVFLPNITSSKIPNSGMGLTYAKESIQALNGLLTIKTNSLKLFLSPNKDKDKEYIETFEESSHHIGTLITVLIPLKLKDMRYV